MLRWFIWSTSRLARTAVIGLVVFAFLAAIGVSVFIGRFTGGLTASGGGNGTGPSATATATATRGSGWESAPTRPTAATLPSPSSAQDGSADARRVAERFVAAWLLADPVDASWSGLLAPYATAHLLALTVPTDRAVIPRASISRVTTTTLTDAVATVQVDLSNGTALLVTAVKGNAADGSSIWLADDLRPMET